MKKKWKFKFKVLCCSPIINCKVQEVSIMNNIKKGSLIIGITVILLVISPLNIISQEPGKSKEDLNKVNPLSFEWPYDKHSGFLNYSQ